MGLRLYDSASRRVRDFVAINPGHVGIYLCGLTVQSEPHVGHIRSGVCFDVLRRWMVASGYAVTFIRNVTDIDDKILVRAADHQMAWYTLAYRMRRHLDAAYDALNVSLPSYEPAATAHVPEMVELIGRLVERGHAYPAADGSGDVYFDVGSWPDYGSLSGQKVAEMEPAADADPRGKREPRDFALWKGHKPDEPPTASWPSPWGRGRPGWHIECSAMAVKYLGERFDIHAGGVDLRFPHHENEQAQARAAGYDFAGYWLHNSWLTTAGEKMSKSLGNSLLVPAVLQRVRPVELRFYLVAAHYRSTVEFSDEALHEAAAGYRRMESFLRRAAEHLGEPPPTGELPEPFTAAMDDDLSTPEAVAVAHHHVREGNRLADQADTEGVRREAGAVRGMLALLGLDPFAEPWSHRGSRENRRLSEAVDSLVAALLEQREAARRTKDFAQADAIRDRLKQAGVELEDTPSGPRWTLG